MLESLRPRETPICVKSALTNARYDGRLPTDSAPARETLSRDDLRESHPQSYLASASRKCPPAPCKAKYTGNDVPHGQN
eukprot:3638188-Pyramimonas_sp.AAC.1